MKPKTKQILGSIAIFVIFIVIGIADIDFGNGDTPPISSEETWDSSQEPCLEFELPEHLLDGSDSSCAQAARVMKAALDMHVADCIEITNKDWVPTYKRVLSRDEIEYLVALNGAPEPMPTKGD